MGYLEQKKDERSESQRSNVLPLATTVGLLSLFLADAMPGGLTGIQGFFIGFGSVFGLFLVAVLLDGYRNLIPKASKQPSSVSGDITIAHEKTDKGISIHIYLNK